MVCILMAPVDGTGIKSIRGWGLIPLISCLILREEPILEITPRNVIRNKTQVVFSIMAWKDEETLQECNGIISVEEIFFEDELD